MSILLFSHDGTPLHVIGQPRPIRVLIPITKKIYHAMTLKEESVIEMIATKAKKNSVIHDSIYNSENELSHCIYKEMLLKREIRKRKEQLIRELTQNNKDLKQFSYITSHNLRVLYRT
jgi:light-regulated signal transduction histidine kinase (bacteriophytochrome)